MIEVIDKTKTIILDNNYFNVKGKCDSDWRLTAELIVVIYVKG